VVVNGLVEVGVVPELMHFANLNPAKQYLLLLFVGVQHIPDTERKQSVAWAALREAADAFLRPCMNHCRNRSAIKEFNATQAPK